MTTLIDIMPKDKLIEIVRRDLDRICKMEETIKRLERELSEEKRKNRLYKSETTLYAN